MTTPETPTPRTEGYVEYLRLLARACGTLTDKHNNLQNVANLLDTLERENQQLRDQLTEALKQQKDSFQHAEAEASAHDDCRKSLNHHKSRADEWEKMAGELSYTLQALHGTYLQEEHPACVYCQLLSRYQTLKQKEQKL